MAKDEFKYAKKEADRFSAAIPYDDGTLPVTPLENYNMLLRGETPYWMPSSSDEVSIMPRIIPDNLAGGIAMDIPAPPDKPDRKGGLDMFGVDWVFVEMVGGSMPVPGKHLLDDVNDWPEKIIFPDIDEWDWEGNSALLRPALPENKMKIADMACGFFERLISFMDFEGAALAIIDEEQKDAIHALFSKLCDLYDGIIERYQKYYGINMIMFHDDWGSQRAPFFSLATCREMIVPYLKRVVESAHKRGLWFHFHSCGKNEMLVPAMIEAGVDMWKPQPMNDVRMLLDTYDGQLIIPARFDFTNPEAEQDEVDAEAAKFFESLGGHKNTTLNISALMIGSPAFPKYCKAFYRMTREAYGRK